MFPKKEIEFGALSDDEIHIRTLTNRETNCIPNPYQVGNAKDEQIFQVKQQQSQYSIEEASNCSINNNSSCSSSLGVILPIGSGQSANSMNPSSTFTANSVPNNTSETYITPPTRGADQLEYRTAWFDPPKKSKAKRRHRYQVCSAYMESVKKRLEFSDMQDETSNKMASKGIAFDSFEQQQQKQDQQQNSSSNDQSQEDDYEFDQSSSMSNSSEDSDSVGLHAPIAFSYSSPETTSKRLTAVQKQYHNPESPPELNSETQGNNATRANSHFESPRTPVKLSMPSYQQQQNQAATKCSKNISTTSRVQSILKFR